MIGFPSSGIVTANFAATLAGLCLTNTERYKIERVSTRVGCYVHANRNQIVEAFLKTNNEWLLQIDPDIAVDGDLIFRLLGMARDKFAHVVSGWYMNDVQMDQAKRLIPLVFKHQGGGLYQPFLPQGNGPVEADAVGTGCLMVHRDVYEKVRKSGPSPWFDFATASNGTLTGEDIFFCQTLKEWGYQIWVDPLSQVRHFKMKELG